MKKRSQVRKMTVQKVDQIIQTQTIPEMLKMYAQHVQSKNAALQEQKAQLLTQLNKVREKTQKTIYQMNDNVKDRFQKKEKIVMTAKSRPTNEDVKNMTELYSYMQNQTNLIARNNEDIDKVQKTANQIKGSSEYPVCDYTNLDKIYETLDKKCQNQEIVRDEIASDRQKRRNFYKTISETIEQYRIKYDVVEKEIEDKEKELDHLITYFKTRQQEDEQKIKNQSNLTIALETQLLKAQQIVNYNSTKTIDLKIQKIQYDGIQ